MSGMPASAPLPRQGEVFFDVRGDSRSMRLSWYAGTGIAVFSIWQGGGCTSTFRLPLSDLPRMAALLATGPPPEVPPPYPGQRLADDRGRPAADYQDEPADYQERPWADYRARPRPDDYRARPQPGDYRDQVAEYHSQWPADYHARPPADYRAQLPGPADFPASPRAAEIPGYPGSGRPSADFPTDQDYCAHAAAPRW